MSSHLNLAVRALCGMLLFVAVVFAGGVGVSRCTLASYVPIPWQCTLWIFFPVIGALGAGAVVAVQSPRLSVLTASLVVLLGLLIAVPLNYLRGWYGSDLAYAVGMAFVGCFIPAIATSSLGCHFHNRRQQNAL
jgi:hypothetical protein